MTPPDSSNLGAILKAYRSVHGLTQGQLAELLLTTQPNLSKIESGKQPVRDVEQLRWMADRLNLPHERLGLLPDRSSEGLPSESLACALGIVGDSQRTWWTVRREMNRSRHILGLHAARLYDVALRPEPAGVLADPRWLPAEPVDLAAVELTWRTNPSPPTFTGGEPQAEGVLPYASDGRRYDRYSRAMRDLARPTLFDNRVCYRPLSLAWKDGGGAFSFGYTSYFETLDVCEALGHEYTAAWLANGRTPPTLDQLPFRASIGDPFDPMLRPMPLSINTLTVRKGLDGHASFLLHKRSSAAVAAAGGMYHVVPAGVFQPSSIAPWHQANDFDLWRNVMREMSEELLGAREHDGNSGQPIDYATAEPFRSMTQARDEGRVRAYCLA
jgi:transcriptional regulator with XRE-family HTH domain